MSWICCLSVKYLRVFQIHWYNLGVYEERENSSNDMNVTTDTSAWQGTCVVREFSSVVLNYYPDGQSCTGYYHPLLSMSHQVTFITFRLACGWWSTLWRKRQWDLHRQSLSRRCSQLLYTKQGAVQRERELLLTHYWLSSFLWVCIRSKVQCREIDARSEIDAHLQVSLCRKKAPKCCRWHRIRLERVPTEVVKVIAMCFQVLCLNDGDLVVMDGAFQQRYLHSLPQSAEIGDWKSISCVSSRRACDCSLCACCLAWPLGLRPACGRWRTSEFNMEMDCESLERLCGCVLKPKWYNCDQRCCIRHIEAACIDVTQRMRAQKSYDVMQRMVAYYCSTDKFLITVIWCHAENVTSYDSYWKLVSAAVICQHFLILRIQFCVMK